MANLKILIHVLDDDPILLEFIEDTFKNDVYEVKCFSDPNKFKAEFNKSVDLIITDVRLPGYDVLSTIQTISKINPACYIIVISGFFEKEILMKFIRLRVDDVIEKGPSLDWLSQLKEAVERLKPKLLDKARTKQ